MYRFWNACNLRFNICLGEWKNDSVETNGYTISVSIGANKWNMYELLVEFKYRCVSKGPKDISEIHMYKITICTNYMGLSLEPFRNGFQYNLLVYRRHYMNLVIFKKVLLDGTTVQNKAMRTRELPVIPAKAGIYTWPNLDSRFRGNDDILQ